MIGKTMKEPPVKLEDILDAFECPYPEGIAYVNRRTGEVVVTQEEYRRLAEEDDDTDAERPDWEKEEIALTRTVLENEGDLYLALPTQFDIHEHNIMERFARQVEDDGISDDLQAALRGRGGFRRFKDAVYRHEMQEQWFRFRDDTLRKIAIDWCEENHIAFVEGKK